MLKRTGILLGLAAICQVSTAVAQEAQMTPTKEATAVAAPVKTKFYNARILSPSTSPRHRFISPAARSMWASAI